MWPSGAYVSKEEPQRIFFDFEEDLGVAKMTQSLKKCFLGQKIFIFEGFFPTPNIK